MVSCCFMLSLEGSLPLAEGDFMFLAVEAGTARKREWEEGMAEHVDLI